MVLPAEILDYILSLLPPSELQSTTLNLTRALGRDNSISESLLFRNLRLTRESQSWDCAKVLRSREGLRSSVRTVNAEVWRDDPQLLINLLQSFPNVIDISLTVGPLFSPEVIEELLTASKFKLSIKTLRMRFNPYVMERSYYTFLKGTYFDITPLTIASWKEGVAPNLTRVSFIQDLPPNHGSKTKVTPAFGLTNLSSLADELAGIEEEIIVQEEENVSTTTSSYKKDLNFAQPIVFFKLDCLTTLATSATGSQLTHLILRLPRRNLLPSLTLFPYAPLPTPFRSLLHLDLSTTHILAHSPQLPLLLRLHPNLEHLILDRVTGLISKGDQKEHSAYLILIWLSKCSAGVGLSRSEDIMRAWRKCGKDRPTGLAAEGPPPDSPAEVVVVVEKKERKGNNRSGFANMPRAAKKPTVVKGLDSVNALFKSRLPMLVKDILIIPSRPKLKSLGLGLLSDLSTSTQNFWTTSFKEGYNDTIKKTVEKGEANLERWQLWSNNGSLEDGTRRLVAFRDAALEVGWVESPETDEVFDQFCKERGIVSISIAIANEIINRVRDHQFVFCTTPDCSGEPGKPHLSLLTVSKESLAVREKREKKLWQEEAEERIKWRKNEKEHAIGCAHLEGRLVWDQE